MTFDEKLKARARSEGSPTPFDFDDRVAQRLQTLPAQRHPARRRLPLRRTVLIGVAAAICLAGAAAAAPAVISMAQGAVDYFSGAQDSPYASQQAKLEKYNAAVGVSQTNGDQTLTIDNLAVDDSYLNVFYTLSSKTPLTLPGTDDEPAEWRTRFAAPHFWAVVDGKKLEPVATTESNVYTVDECTLKGMERIALTRALPDEFELLLYTGGTDAVEDAEFQFSLAVNKSAVAVESLSVEPKSDFSVGKHNVRVERVSISPFGSTITLSEVSADPFTSFVLRDDQGKYLTLLPAGSIGSGAFRNRVRNVFEFLGADTNTKSITLIPIAADNTAHRVTGALNDLPLTDVTAGGMTLESLTIGKDKAVATFSTEGAMWLSAAQFALTGADGKDLSFSGDTYAESSIDRETGLVTATLYYPQATPEELAKAKGVSFWQDDPFKLLEDQAVTIPLQ